MISGGSKGAPPARALPSTAQNALDFMQFFFGNFDKTYIDALPGGSAPLSYRESWICLDDIIYRSGTVNSKSFIGFASN